MATTFKTLGSNDVTTTRTLLHEAIPVTGSILSGTYGGDAVALGSEPHIKTYSHGMFESVFDYPYLSSSANHIFDITSGYSSTSLLTSLPTQVIERWCGVSSGKSKALLITEYFVK